MRRTAKAWVGALTALLGSLAVAASEGGISLSEWLTSAATGLAAFGTVFGVKNAPASTDPE